jgi:undecaprenyl-diphosphatase
VSLDAALFRLLNVTWGTDALAPLMKRITDPQTFLPFGIALVVWMVWRDGWRGRVTVLGLLLLVTASDQISSHVVKPLVARPRPCRVEAGIEGVKTHGARCSRRGSFPSSHAANCGAALAFLAFRYRRRWVLGIGIPLASAVGYSRIYLGLHYPSDILGGWVLGGLVGWVFVALADRIAPERGREAPRPGLVS